MAGSDQFELYPAAFAGAAPFNLRQVGQGDWSRGGQQRRIIPASATRPLTVLTQMIGPSVRFTTTDLLTVLTNLSLTQGYYCSSGADIYYQQRSQGAVYEAGSVHMRVQSRRGMLILESITVSGNEPAVANLIYYELFDGTNEPSAPTAASALGASTPAFVSEYYRGVSRLNSVAFGALESFSLMLNPAVNTRTFDGETTPSRCSIDRTMPLVALNIAKVTEFGGKITGCKGDAYATLLDVFLKKGKASGTRDTGATAISFGTSAGHLYAEGISGQAGSDAMLQIIAEPTDVIAMNTGATHP